MDDIYWCSTCLNASTRPRIVFDSQGRCNACVWAEQKQNLDWASREKQLISTLDSLKPSHFGFDCLVPVSGGKDGSYVAHQLRHVYGKNPLTVTVRPALALETGDRNLHNFIEKGYPHIHVSPDRETMQRLNKYGFIERGFPYFGWLTAILTVPIQTALQFGIELIMYSEDGEVEYGGVTTTADSPFYDFNYMKDIYLQGGYDEVLEKASLPSAQLGFFQFPSKDAFFSESLKVAHWSFFEPWDPYRNYLVAKEHCGLTEAQESGIGTFTNYAQNDQALYALHTYLMYLKYGFGRATQDAGIEIRRNSMSREQALHLVRMYDNAYPYAYIDRYLSYFEMTLEEFHEVLAKWANPDLFSFTNGAFEPKFMPR